MLFNYICREFRQLIKKSSRGRRPSTTEIETRVFNEFINWFQRRVGCQIVHFLLFTMFSFNYG